MTHPLSRTFQAEAFKAEALQYDAHIERATCLSMERHVDGASITLGAFIKRSVPHSIPLFQRNFSWKVVNVERLLKDEWQDYKQKRTTFLGSIVTQQDKGSDCNIIDGQQRLTTVNLILLALREMFKLGESQRDVDFYDEILLTAGVRHQTQYMPVRSSFGLQRPTQCFSAAKQ